MLTQRPCRYTRNVVTQNTRAFARSLSALLLLLGALASGELRADPVASEGGEGVVGPARAACPDVTGLLEALATGTSRSEIARTADASWPSFSQRLLDNRAAFRAALGGDLYGNDVVSEAAWRRADALYEEALALNECRLTLLRLLSPQLRSMLTSFGSGGLEQVLNAAEYAELVIRYRVQAVPRYVRGLPDRFLQEPLYYLGALLKFLFVVFAFRWWRRRGDALLDRQVARFTRTREDPRENRLLAALAWYLRRVRRPIEWLLLLWAALYVVLGQAAERPAEVELAWLVVRWVLIGRGLVLLLDALAVRFAEKQRVRRGNERLRRHSLRFVVMAGVLTGLLLAITEEVVGRGSIYAWMLGTCWSFAVVLAVYLLLRWRRVVLERIPEKARQNALTRWVQEHGSGLASLPATLVGGTWLLAEGVLRWLLSVGAEHEVVRRMLAFLFHRELERQARRQREELVLDGLSDELREAFKPTAPPPGEPLAVPGRDPARVVDELLAGASSRVLVVGERGTGKTTLLDAVGRLLDQRDDIDRILTVTCPVGGYAGLIDELHTALGRPLVDGGAGSRDEAALLALLREQQPRVIVVDDAQRLVRPVIGGLADLDRLLGLARNLSGETSWLFGLGEAAWQFVRRARGAYPLFDHIHVLPHWDEASIAAMLAERNRAAGLSPCFDHLDMPDPLEGTHVDGDEEESLERRFYRMLWDYSDGNPTVALYAWRECLGVRRESPDAVVVRFFERPDAAVIERLPLDVLFVLRAIVQLEMASTRDVARATQLAPDVVSDATRYGLGRGFLVSVRGHIQIDWAWYRTITRVLERQHLLVRGGGLS